MIRAGVMGWPVEHSRSPPEGFRAALSALAEKGFAGCNLTLPHKEAALAIIDHVDASARRIGAVNTIVVRGDRSLEGRNTDSFGFIENLRAGAPDWRTDRGAAVVLGAGGAARAVVAALVDAGVPELRLLNRHRARAESLAAALGGNIRVLDWEARSRSLAGAALLVNTTSLGMHGAPPLGLTLDALDPAAAVNDIVYAPLETPLLAAARRRGNTAVDGLGMLLHQARPAFAAWFGIMPEVTPDLRRTIEATLRP
jgi:shikimate dehydrogenase